MKEFGKRVQALQLASESPIPHNESPEKIFAVTRGEGDEKTDIVRQAASYTPSGISRFTQFVSTSPVEELWNTLACFVEKTATDHKESKKKYKCTLSLSGGKKGKEVKMAVNILRVKETEKHLV